MERRLLRRQVLCLRRRNLIAMVAGAALAWPLVASGQQSALRHRIAFIHSAIPADQLTESAGPFWVRRFFETLRGLGDVEGINLIVERYSAEGRSDRFATLANTVVSRKPDLIVTNLNALAAALRTATNVIPIVAIIGDPIRSGLVKSLALPGGNVTGVSVDAGYEIYGKELQILKETIPSATKVGFLASRGLWEGSPGQMLRETGQRTGITLIEVSPQQVNDTQIRRKFADMARGELHAVVVSYSGDFLAHRALIVDLAARYRIPAMYPYRDYMDAGGLMAYAPDLGELAQRLAADVHQILQGADPGKIPIYQPTKIGLVVNLKTAKALGLAIPPTLLARADEVIE